MEARAAAVAHRVRCGGAAGGPACRTASSAARGRAATEILPTAASGEAQCKGSQSRHRSKFSHCPHLKTKCRCVPTHASVHVDPFANDLRCHEDQELILV